MFLARTLDIRENIVSGSVPTTLGGLSDLAYLSVSSNQLSSTVPTFLGSLTALKYVHAWHHSRRCLVIWNNIKACEWCLELWHSVYFGLVGVRLKCRVIVVHDTDRVS